MKEFKTIDEQIELLKNRGLNFINEQNAIQILKTNNYYNVINGYKKLFIKENKDDIFIDGATFEEIYSLYEFDRRLRNIFLESILKIENSLRTLVSYYFSMHHGYDNYLRLDNFENFKDIKVNAKTKENQIRYIQNLIGTINKKIANAISSKSYVQHYMIDYGYIPMWVLVNIMSFGDICNFLKLMKQNERILISKEFNIMEFDLTNLVGILAHTRNLCAHDERLYDYIFPTSKTINDNIYHKKLKISLANNRYKKGKNDLFAVVIALKILLKEEDYKIFHNKLFSRFMSLETKLHTIKINDVLNAMNFPNNWHDIIKMS